MTSQDFHRPHGKLCTRCEAVLPADTYHFKPAPHLSSGLSSWCRECWAGYHRLYRARRKAAPTLVLRLCGHALPNEVAAAGERIESWGAAQRAGA